MLVEAGVLGRQHRMDDMRRDLLDRHRIVLPDTASADDFAILVGERHGILPALVPDVAGVVERRDGNHRDDDRHPHAEGQGIVRQIDRDPGEASDPEALEPGGIGRP